MDGILTIGQRIARNTSIIEEWLARKSLPTPSFEYNALESFPPIVDEPKIEASRRAILEDTNLLHDLISGPDEALRKLCWGAIDNSVQQCIDRFAILPAVPLDGDGTTYPELSAKVGLPLPQLKALVRQSALNHVLRETDRGRVTHTAASAMLVRNRPMADWYGHCVQELFPTGARAAEALEQSRRAHTSNGAKSNSNGDSGDGSGSDSAFSLAFATPDSFYTFLEKHPTRQARFFGAMEGVGKDPGHSLEHVVQGYPWAELSKNATVVDVGGSSGTLSTALARAHPEGLGQIVVQDFARNVAEGAAALPAELAATGRVRFEAHDFFAPQPVRGADVYLLRHVLHNWGNDACARILRRIVEVMRPERAGGSRGGGAGSRILLVEVVVRPAGREGDGVAERYMRNIDITMLQMLNTQERSEEEWGEVVRAADERLRITRVIRPEGSWDSILELRLEG